MNLLDSILSANKDGIKNFDKDNYKRSIVRDIEATIDNLVIQISKKNLDLLKGIRDDVEQSKLSAEGLIKNWTGLKELEDKLEVALEMYEKLFGEKYKTLEIDSLESIVKSITPKKKEVPSKEPKEIPEP